MTTLRLDTRTNLTIIAPGGLPFSALITINDGLTDYTGYLGFWNIGNPDNPDEALVLGSNVTGEAVGGLGSVTLSLTKEEMAALPRRPLPYEVWLESTDGTDVVQVAGGLFSVQTFSGSTGFPPVVPEEDAVIDGGGV